MSNRDLSFGEALRSAGRKPGGPAGRSLHPLSAYRGRKCFIGHFRLIFIGEARLLDYLS
jgi:hypothetical protein